MSNTITIENRAQLSNIYKNKEITNIKNIHTIVFKSYTFEDDFIINNINYNYLNNNEKEKIYLTLIFENCTFEKAFQISFKQYNTFNFKALSIINYNKKEMKRIKEFILENIEVEKFYFKEYECDLIKLFNVDFIENSKILFENLITNRLLLEKISQDSKFIQFHQIIVNNELFCERVEFKNTYFNDFKLNSAKNVKLIKTSFIDAHLNSVIWGDLSRIIAKKDIIRQLKYVNDNIGNYIQGNNFFAEEMRRHQKDIKNKEGNLLERIVLFFNSEISDFGQNWFLPFLWIIVITFSLILIKNEEINSFYTISFFSIVFFGSTFRIVDYICENSSSSNLELFLLPLCTVIFCYYYSNYTNISDLVYLLSIKPPKDTNNLFLQYWVLHKVLIAFPLYHFTISLRRLTRR